jgi:hypothetical protein
MVVFVLVYPVPLYLGRLGGLRNRKEIFVLAERMKAPEQDTLNFDPKVTKRTGHIFICKYKVYPNC